MPGPACLCDPLSPWSHCSDPSCPGQDSDRLRAFVLAVPAAWSSPQPEWSLPLPLSTLTVRCPRLSSSSLLQCRPPPHCAPLLGTGFCSLHTPGTPWHQWLPWGYPSERPCADSIVWCYIECLSSVQGCDSSLQVPPDTSES